MWSSYAAEVNPMVAAGSFYIIGLRADGTVAATGENYNGECNVNLWHSIIAVSAKCQHTIGLKSDGTVLATGYNFFGQCNTGSWSDIVDVAAGYGHTVGLRSDGTVVATGIRGPQCNVNSWSEITAVVAGVEHTLGLKKDGSVVAAGYGSECDVNSWNEITALAAGRNFSVGLKSDGTVVATGNNMFGQCDVDSWSGIIAVAVGENHTIGLKEDGTMVATGDNRYGQCNVNSWSGIVAIAGGLSQTIGLESKGTVLATGSNDLDHQFNLGTWNKFTPDDSVGWYSADLIFDHPTVAAGNHDFPGCNIDSWHNSKKLVFTKPEKILGFLTGLVSEEKISADINALTSFQTRNTYSPYINDVADWVKSRFSQIGYSGIYDQHYTKEGLELRNIIAMKKGYGKTGKVILICAHYDCTMEEYTDGQSMAPGADDNASGMASLIELARIVAKIKIFEDIYFAAFSGEEQGFWGSSAYAQYIKNNNINLQQVINIDMIGYAPDGNSIIIEQDEGNEVESNDEPSEKFAAKMAQMAVDYTDLTVSFGEIYESDYMPFEELGYVCVGAYEAEENPDYHSTNDVVENLNIPFIAEVTKMVLATACHEALKLPKACKYVCNNWGKSHFKHKKRRHSCEIINRYSMTHWNH